MTSPLDLCSLGPCVMILRPFRVLWIFFNLKVWAESRIQENRMMVHQELKSNISLNSSDWHIFFCQKLVKCFTWLKYALSLKVNGYSFGGSYCLFCLQPHLYIWAFELVNMKKCTFLLLLGSVIWKCMRIQPLSILALKVI